MLKADLYGIGSIDYSKDKVASSSGGEAAFTHLLERGDKLSEEIAEEIGQLWTLRNEMIEKIEQLPDDRYRNILFKRYVEYKSIEQIAVEMNYNYPYIVELHGYALRAFEKLYM